MIIRRKVFSIVEIDGEERLFSTNEVELEQRDFARGEDFQFTQEQKSARLKELKAKGKSTKDAAKILERERVAMDRKLQKEANKMRTEHLKNPSKSANAAGYNKGMAEGLSKGKNSATITQAVKNTWNSGKSGKAKLIGAGVAAGLATAGAGKAAYDSLRKKKD